jgi:hypothetical protein
MDKIAIIILWTNGTVTVFDEDENQVLQYQGQLGRVLNAILGETTDFTVKFFFGDPAKGLWPSSRAAFLRMVQHE